MEVLRGRVRILCLIVRRLIRDVDATVFHGVCGEIRVFVDAHGLRALEEPAEVVPELRSVTHVGCADMAQLMERYEGDNILIDELFTLIALTETHIDLFALIHGVRRVRGIGGRLRETTGIRVKIAAHLFDECLVRVRLLEIAHQSDELATGAGQTICSVLFVGQIAHEIALAIKGALHGGHLMTTVFESHRGQAGTDDTKNESVWTGGAHDGSLWWASKNDSTVYQICMNVHKGGAEWLDEESCDHIFISENTELYRRHIDLYTSDDVIHLI